MNILPKRKRRVKKAQEEQPETEGKVSKKKAVKKIMPKNKRQYQRQYRELDLAVKSNSRKRLIIYILDKSGNRTLLLRGRN